MPLLTEFCIRKGEYEVLICTLGETGVEYPTSELILATRQLEEMLAFNSNLFTRRQLGSMFRRLCSLWEIGLRQPWPELRGIHRSSPVRPNAHYREGWKVDGEELADSIDAIKEKCRGALSRSCVPGREGRDAAREMWPTSGTVTANPPVHTGRTEPRKPKSPMASGLDKRLESLRKNSSFDW